MLAGKVDYNFWAFLTERWLANTHTHTHWILLLETDFSLYTGHASMLGWCSAFWLWFLRDFLHLYFEKQTWETTMGPLWRNYKLVRVISGTENSWPSAHLDFSLFMNSSSSLAWGIYRIRQMLTLRLCLQRLIWMM